MDYADHDAIAPLVTTAGKQITISLTRDEAELYELSIDNILSIDVFSSDCIGNWAEAVCRVEVEGEIRRLLRVTDDGSIKNRSKAIQALKDGQELPKGYHYLNRDTAETIISRGVLEHGVGFIDGTTDAYDLDTIIQKVLLGEEVYC